MAGYEYNPLLKEGLQKKQDIPTPPPTTVDDELSPTSTNPVQNKVITNKIDEITSDSIDIDVSTLAEFVAAVERSTEVSVRIHLRADISLAENLTVNLDNCQIYGHDNRIFLENHTFLIQGEYCYFYQVRFNASSLVTGQTANQSDYFNARIKIVSTKSSTRFFFEYVIFMNFVCHSFDEQHTIIEVDTTSSGYPSLHTYFLYCEVMTNYLGNNLPRINNCVWSLENVGNSLHCITAHIIDYWGVGFDGTNYDSTKNFNFSGNSLKGFAKLGFTSDASINYAASPSGYTSLTPNAVNIYNPSSSEFQSLYDYVHGNNFATAAQGAKADSALQSIGKGTDGDYITTTVTAKDANNQQKVGASLTIQDITTADSTHKGLAEASDVRNYLNIIAATSEAYGVMWDSANPSPSLYRIGNMQNHALLPVQSQMIGGVMADDGTFTPFDNQADWTQATQARDGSDGQVMVRIPRHWRRCSTFGTYNIVMISPIEIPGYVEVREQYVSAYEASLQRSTLKLSSVNNATADYRGGHDEASWDGTYRTLLNRPVSNLNLAEFRTYARNRGNGTKWNCMTYEAVRTIYWLFVTEYATLNSQAEYTSELDANGYHQGGLGIGVSDWNDTAWDNYNGYAPLIPCGVLDEYGSGTAVKNFSIYNADSTLAHTFQGNKYRGIEMPFAHIWKDVDGVLINVESGDGVSTAYTTIDPANFSSTSVANYNAICTTYRVDSYIKGIVFNTDGDIFATQNGANSTSYYCDLYWGANLPSTTELRAWYFGGPAIHSAFCGLACESSHHAPGYRFRNLGSRLCFIP